MSLKYVFIASAVLIAFCGADVSEIKANKVDLPFNDLLPPLLDESSTTTTTTTTTVRTTTTLATKPTKKSYYQKPAQLAKEDKSKSSVSKQDVPQLPLDLLPPFEDEAKPAEEKPQQVVKTTPKPVVKVTQPAVLKYTTTTAPKITHPATPRPQYSIQPAPASRPQYSAHPPPQVVQNNPSYGSGFQSRFSNYFLTSTVRPRRGPLPTITPFPRFVRL
ncbi:extensin [Drosophila eugracilis]|uniref:extensin n=1 Tax=Drosophila eugracilis TaxID=29029 RepID=UPI0007E76CE1|nr:extensin [Drosophila eugracilis]